MVRTVCHSRAREMARVVAETTTNFSVVSGSQLRDINPYRYRVRIMQYRSVGVSSALSILSLVVPQTHLLVGHVYASLLQEPLDTGAIVEGTLFIDDILNCILFDFGASYSFIEKHYISLSLTLEVLQIPLEISSQQAGPQSRDGLVDISTQILIIQNSLITL